MALPRSQIQILKSLREKIHQLETPATLDRAPIGTGIAGLDAWLPGGGLRSGTLVEWLSAGEGSGAGSLALLSAREACRNGRIFVVVDPLGEFYALSAFSEECGRLERSFLVVRPESMRDLRWTLCQTLQCPAVGAVLSWLDRVDSRTMRRLQLAAETGGGIGLFLRPDSVRSQPSWADIRWRLAPIPREAPPPLTRGDQGGSQAERQVRSDRSPRSNASAADAELHQKTEEPLLEDIVSRPATPCSPPYQGGQSAIGEGRRWRIELLRCRGGVEGRAGELASDETTNRVRLVSELAGATAAADANGTPHH